MFGGDWSSILVCLVSVSVLIEQYTTQKSRLNEVRRFVPLPDYASTFLMLHNGHGWRAAASVWQKNEDIGGR